MYDIHDHILLTGKPKELSRFGIEAIGVTMSDSYDFKLYEELKKKTEIKTFSVLEIHATTAGDVKKGVAKYRNKVDMIIVHAKDQKATRAAAEHKDVDAIAHAFLDQTSAREAARNSVAIEINLRDFLNLSGMRRAIWISKLNFNLELARKYKTPIVITTGAWDIYDLRSPKQILALAEVLGLTNAEAKRALFEEPRKILKRSQDKKKGKTIGKGVKIVK
jgi:ribonuclease P/MRP protein subunit RPP1